MAQTSSPRGAAPLLRVSVLVIGDEILSGFVQDTNSGWLAGRLQVLGIPLERIVTLPDDVGAIDEALRTELGRVRPRLVLTSGGIGSTPDDLTMEGVAGHLGVDLVVDARIDGRITRALAWAEEEGGSVSPAQEAAMRRMARVPHGAYLLAGPDAIAPGVAVDVDGGCAAPGGATIVVLPGVPSLLRQIMRDRIEPQLLAGRGKPQHVAEVTHGYPESVLTPILDELVAAFPDVHVGSYPGRECVIRLKGRQDRVVAAMARVEAALAALEGDPGATALRSAWGGFGD
jgi:molybdenum cofactor synthesis domain-containing protein